MSKLTVVVTTMHQTDLEIYKRMNLQTDAVIGNQAADNWERAEIIDGHGVKMVTTDKRGTSLNRNTAMDNVDLSAEYVMFSDDDLCFYDGYEQMVLDAFATLPDVDAVKFNVRCAWRLFRNLIALIDERLLLGACVVWRSRQMC